VDWLLAWLVERLGPRAVSRTAKVMAAICGLATLAFVANFVIAVIR
jgi:hypothetical protein